MTPIPHLESFDYIIVGAGSAGCVLANRLTASGRHRVLLLEAGGRHNIWIHIPLGYGKLFGNARVNWLYATEPEPELNNRKIIQPRGKVLGGSSSINGLLYVRGQPEDFDHWRQLGNAGQTNHRTTAMPTDSSTRSHTALQTSRNSRGEYVTGHIGGPGRPRGSRNRLSEQFIADLQADWEQYGAAVIERHAGDASSDRAGNASRSEATARIRGIAIRVRFGAWGTVLDGRALPGCWNGLPKLLGSKSKFIRTCCGTPAGSNWPTTASIPGPYRLISATRASSIR
jgi:choline dehydrogenase-like flavoprotein